MLLSHFHSPSILIIYRYFSTIFILLLLSGYSILFQFIDLFFCSVLSFQILVPLPG